jgi:hypothetical protein
MTSSPSKVKKLGGMARLGGEKRRSFAAQTRNTARGGIDRSSARRSSSATISSSSAAVKIAAGPHSS